MHITFDESNVLFEGKSSSANPSTQVKDLAADLEKIDLTDPPQVVTTNIPLQLRNLVKKFLQMKLKTQKS